ncbi:MAG: ABC transporter permease [Pirellulaceae bacterium]|nr:ABC transporter permease [Pirellulaceae bacterium]
MWVYIIRRLAYNVPVYLGIILLVMAALRVNDPIYGFLGKNASREQYDRFAAATGLDQPFLVQYVRFLGDIARLDFTTESWDQPGISVGQLLSTAIMPSLALTVPALLLTTLISISVGMISAYYRGRLPDRLLVLLAVLGMSVSFLVYIILGQYFGAFWLNRWLGYELFAIAGYKPGLIHWPRYCLLPVMISVIVAMGYDTRFYRAAMVEETGKDYIVTARAKGAGQAKLMFVHMLKNAMIPIITRVMITIPLLITGSILLEMYFNIPGMGRRLILAINAKDFPVVQTFTAVFAAVFIVTNILTDVLYALVDPRVRLS